jgi:hypothetical protein
MGAAIPIVQLVAYVMLTLASVTVAGLSAFFAYRSNYGWKPLALILWQGVGFGKIAGQHTAIVDLEIWNSPIVIHDVVVEFKSMPFQPKAGLPEDKDVWLQIDRRFYYRKRLKALASTEHIELSLEAPLVEGAETGTLNDIVLLRVYYFDPLSKRQRVVRSRYIYYVK